MTSNARGTVRGNVTLHPFVSAGAGGDVDSSVAFMAFGQPDLDRICPILTKPKVCTSLRTQMRDLGRSKIALILSFSFAFRLRLQFPEHVDDFPVTVKFSDLEIIDPIGGDDFHDGGVIVAIENCY